MDRRNLLLAGGSLAIAALAGIALLSGPATENPSGSRASLDTARPVSPAALDPSPAALPVDRHELSVEMPTSVLLHVVDADTGAELSDVAVFEIRNPFARDRDTDPDHSVARGSSPLELPAPLFVNDAEDSPPRRPILRIHAASHAAE